MSDGEVGGCVLVSLPLIQFPLSCVVVMSIFCVFRNLFYEMLHVFPVTR